MLRTAAPLRPVRAVTLALLVAFMVCLGATAASAVEEGAEPTEHGPAPSIEEIGTQNDVSQQYLPEPAEPPPFMRFLYVPLIIAGIVIIGLLLMLYLVWQPRFAEERRSRRR